MPAGRAASRVVLRDVALGNNGARSAAAALATVKAAKVPARIFTQTVRGRLFRIPV
jgi:hypothetical protein